MSEVPAMVTFAEQCGAGGAPIGTDGADYRSLWRWSVDDPTAFWVAVQEFFSVSMEGNRRL